MKEFTIDNVEFKNDLEAQLASVKLIKFMASEFNIRCKVQCGLRQDGKYDVSVKED